MFEHVRALVRDIVPDAGEKVSYGVPCFTHKGKYVLYFGAFKNHMSLFPASDDMVAAIPELKDFRTSKGTLQFTEAKPISDDAIKQMVLYNKTNIDT